VKETKIVASSGFTSSYVAFCESTFYQTIYQNGSSSTDRAVYRAKAPKNSFIGEVKPCQTRLYNDQEGNNMHIFHVIEIWLGCLLSLSTWHFLLWKLYILESLGVVLSFFLIYSLHPKLLSHFKNLE